MKIMQVCHILKELRTNHKPKKLSTEKVSEICGVNQSTYNRWETGDSKIPFEAVIKLSKFYGVSLDYFTGNSSEAPSIGITTDDLALLSNNYDTLFNKLEKIVHANESKEFSEVKEIDLIFISASTYQDAYRQLTEAQYDRWLKSFKQITDDYGLFRTAFFYSRFHYSRKDEVSKGSPFTDPPAWFKERLPNYMEIILPKQNRNDDSGRGIA